MPRNKEMPNIIPPKREYKRIPENLKQKADDERKKEKTEKVLKPIAIPAEIQGKAVANKDIKSAIVKGLNKAYELSKGKLIQNPRVYQMFIVWRIIPPMMKGKMPEELNQLGITDDIFQQLVAIKTKKDFAKKMGVSEATLVRWESDIAVIASEAEARKFFSQMTWTYLMKFYMRQLKDPTPEGIKTWMQIVHQWNPTMNIQHNHTVEHTISEEEKQKILKIIRENRGY